MSEHEDATEPDVEFALSPASDDVGTEVDGDADDLAQQLAQRLADDGPAGWQEFEAAFALTVVAGTAQLTYTVGTETNSMEPSTRLLELVGSQRRASIQQYGQPWWRLLVRGNNTGGFDVTYDFGDEPFPESDLFPPDVYRADLAAFPRDRLPVWLAAYIGHDNRQARTPQQAAEAARADEAAGTWPTLLDNELPALSEVFARWAVIAAGFVAVRATRGPRISPSAGSFENANHGGATLFVLPGDRAVLSGGIWNASILDDVYNNAVAMPKFYAGAPDWVADSVLSPRAGTGLLSFCYWWDGGQWYRGESLPVETAAPAIPGVWTIDTTVSIITRLVDEQPSQKLLTAATELVSAAELGVVTRETLCAVFDDEQLFDIDGALYQLSLAGVVARLPRQMPEQQAIARVRNYILDRDLDTTGYPLSELVADRFSCGWMVYVPVPEGEIAIGRAIFYVADDGVLEHSSSSVAPAVFVPEFEQRYGQRADVRV